MQGRDDETSYGENGIELVEKPWETVPNLPDWRFNFGLSLRLRQGKPPAAKPEVEAAPLVQEEPEKEEKKSKKEKKDKKEEARDYRELENQLKKRGDKKGEETEEERERKRQAERERMQDVLDRLREAMEKEKNQPESPQE